MSEPNDHTTKCKRRKSMKKYLNIKRLILVLIRIKIKQNSIQIGHKFLTINTGAWGSGKTNVMLNLINYQPDIDNIYMYAKEPYEAKQ